MEGLNNLNAKQLQPLLEKCQSVKAKRLLMYLAEKAGHEWFKYLDLNKIDLGNGERSIVKNGVYVSKYKITVPKDLAEHDKTSILKSGCAFAKCPAGSCEGKLFRASWRESDQSFHPGYAATFW